MKTEELKNLILKSLEGEEPDPLIQKQLKEAGVDFSFSSDFSNKVFEKTFYAGKVLNRETDFLRSFSSAFYRIAITGIAVIILLVISIYISQGFISFDSFFGLNNAEEESIVCIMTGN